MITFCLLRNGYIFLGFSNQLIHLKFGSKFRDPGQPNTAKITSKIDNSFFYMISQSRVFLIL
jgi:hypothetical protein